MEHGSLQVRIGVDGARGAGVLVLPIPAAAQRTLGMNHTLGGVLFGPMVLLALALVSIAGSAVRAAAIEPGAVPAPRGRRRALIASGVFDVAVQ